MTRQVFQEVVYDFIFSSGFVVFNVADAVFEFFHGEAGVHAFPCLLYFCVFDLSSLLYGDLLWFFSEEFV